MFIEIYKSGKFTMDWVDNFKKIESDHGLWMNLYLEIQALVDKPGSLIRLKIIVGNMFPCFMQILKYRETQNC